MQQRKKSEIDKHVISGVSHYLLKIPQSILWELVVILGPFAFFYDVCILTKGLMNLALWQAILMGVLLNGTIMMIIFLAFRNQTPSIDRQGFATISKHLPLIFVLLVAGLLAIEQFDCLPKYDGGLYYDQFLTAVSTFTLSVDSILNSFVLWTHPTYGMMLFLVPSELLLPGSSVGVYWMTLLIFLLSIVGMDRILSKLFPDLHALQRAFITLCYALHPYVLGLFSHVNPDHYSLYYFILMVWAFAYKRETIAAFLCLLLVFTKETGILIAGPFLLWVTISAFLTEQKTDRHKAIQSLLLRIIRYGISPVLYIMYYLFAGSFSFATGQTGESPLRWDSNGIHCFGFSLPYISMRLSQVFFFNLFWVVSMLFLLTVAIFFIRKYIRKHEISPLDGIGRLDMLGAIFASVSVYFIFSILFITLALPRYNVYFVLPSAIIIGIAVRSIWTNKLSRLIASGILIILLLGQNYITIDPSLYLVSSQLNLGNSVICSPTRYGGMPIVYEMYAYNRQFAYTEEILDKLLQDVQLTSQDAIVTVDDGDYELLIIGEELFTENRIYYDPDLGERTYNHTNPNAFIPVEAKLTSRNLSEWKDYNLPDHLVLLLLWRNSDPAYIDALTQLGYTIDQQFTAENYAGIIYAYRLSRE